MHRGIVMDASLCKEVLNPFIEIEHRLYEAGVKVAKVFTYNRKEGFLFMEDLGDTHLFDVINIDFELFYGQALDSIMKMQNTDTEDLPIYDEELLHSQMELTFNSVDKEKQATLNPIFDSIVKEVLSQPSEVFVHGDFHSKNIMFGCSDNIVLIDYENSKMGGITYDLVSLLRDSSVEFTQSDVKRLALAFKDKIGLEVEDAMFMRWFDFTGLQRHIYLLGKENNSKNRALILKYIKLVASQYSETEALIELLR
jgi:aminoglycoside/choline kinase family phosphotransferase